MTEIKKYLNNRNVVLLTCIIVVLGCCLGKFVVSIVDRMELDANKAWEKALKFDSSNEDEFVYAVGTQQGGLFAEGEVLPVSALVTDERLGGEYMAIREIFEEYREHTETYSCNCHTTSEGYTSCQTCIRTYWSWDYAGVDCRKVEEIKLLGQQMGGNFIPWDVANYYDVRLANGDRYYKYSSRKRSSFMVVSSASGGWGFISDENGFRYEPSLNGPKDLGYEIAKWAVWLVFIGGSVALGVANLYYNYEVEDRFI